MNRPYEESEKRFMPSINVNTAENLSRSNLDDIYSRDNSYRKRWHFRRSGQVLAHLGSFSFPSSVHACSLVQLAPTLSVLPVHKIRAREETRRGQLSKGSCWIRVLIN